MGNYYSSIRKTLLLVINVISFCIPAMAQSHDSHLGNAINAINKGDYTRADQELLKVRYWDGEDDHAFHINQVQSAYEYALHCQSTNIPNAVKDSIAAYLVVECGLQVNQFSKSDFHRALQACEKGLQICEITSQKYHENYAVLLLDMSIWAQQRGDIKKALEYGKRAVKVYEDNRLNKKNETYCTVAFLTGGYYILLRQDYVLAYPYIKEAYDICEQLGGATGHQQYATILSTYTKLEGQLGSYYSDCGEYNKAIQHYLKDLRLLEKGKEGKGKQYTVILNNLSGAYCDCGDYQNAIKYGKESLDLRRSIFGESHYEYAVGLHALGVAYMATEDYTQALSYFKRMKQLLERIGKTNDALYAQVLNSLGALYDDTGDLRQAENYLLQAMKMREKLSGKNSSDYANSLNNVATHYLQIGNLEKARDYSEQALKIFESVYGKDHIACAATLGNLGAIYEDLMNYKKAEQYHLRALEIRRKTYGPNHPDCALTLNNLALIYDRRGDYSLALRYHQEALKIRKAVFGEQNIHTAVSYSNIGGVYDAMKDFARAAEYYDKAYSIFLRLHLEQNSMFPSVVSNVGYAYYEMGNYKKAAPFLLKSYELRKTQFLHSMEFMTETERKNYWDAMLYEFEFSLPNLIIECYKIEPLYTGLAYNNQLFYKGALLQSSDAVKRSILESGDSQLIKQWNELDDLRKQILKLQENETEASVLKVKEQQAEQLEKNLTQSSAAYREYSQLDAIKWKDVQKMLKANEVAIEFASVLRYDGDEIYYALVLRNHSEWPTLVPLFEEADVRKILETITPNELYIYNASGRLLYQHIWSKLIRYVNKGETIYFAPSGMLHQLAIESLPVNAEQTMSSMYSMVRLSSTRELVKKNISHTHTSAALYGGIYYDVDIDELTAQSETYSRMSLAGTRAVVDNSFRAGVHYLKGTKREVEEINSILKPQHITTTLYTSNSANEESFKALSGKHTNILHIATHGFYWADTVAQKQRYFTQRTITEPIAHYSYIDPLNRCGLLFAGANIALRGHSNELPANVQDGILTAKEISLLDLRDAQLVVLSACETGKGEVTGEGVFGLQRAFKMAGAQSILMALWKVDDEATRMFMTSFFRYYCQGKDKREAFRLAQKQVRNYSTIEDNKTIYPYKDPYYWAGFILLD